MLPWLFGKSCLYDKLAIVLVQSGLVPCLEHYIYIYIYMHVSGMEILCKYKLCEIKESPAVSMF